MEYSSSDKYLVYRSYYKHAETEVLFFKSQVKFEKYLDEMFYEDNDDLYWQEIKESPIEDKISYAIDQGAYRIDNDIGWGIVHVARISGDVELYGGQTPC